jgi:hypothetical protein
MMIGIPPAGTNESAQFWMAFWPALYSGVIYSIVTGIVVGIVVLFVQRHAEKRAARMSYARELSILKDQIREAMSCPNPFTISSACQSAPHPAKQAVEVVRPWPISLWREELTDHKALLNTIHELQISYSLFMIAAQHLDHLLQQFCRTYNGRRNAISANDPPLWSYILGRLSGFESAHLLPWLNMPSPDVPPWIEEGFTEAEQNKDIISAHGEYMGKRKKLQSTADVLIQELNA